MGPAEGMRMAGGAGTPKPVTQADNAIWKTEGSVREGCKEERGRGGEIRFGRAGFEVTELHPGRAVQDSAGNAARELRRG